MEEVGKREETRTRAHTKGVVSSGHRLASEAGLEVLREGGNAIDAIVTTSLSLSAILPPFSGIGGGGFLMLRLAEGRTTFIDYREVAPSAAKPNMFLDGAGGKNSSKNSNSIGHLAVATPGTIRGLSYALEKYGTIDLGRALESAIRLARNGVEVTRTFRRATEINESKLCRFPHAREIFLMDGKAPEVGSKISFPELSKTFARIASRGEDEFYDGDTASSILGEIEKNGGILKANDLASYAPLEREPVTFELEFEGEEYEFFLAPPPSAGGIQIAQVLEIVGDNLAKLKSSGHNSYDYLLILSRVLGATFAERARSIADPDFFDVDIARLLSPEYVSSIAPQPPFPFSITDSSTSLNRSTSHMCAADAEGNVAALTESIECFYGSGVVPAGTGVILNDTMHDFDTNPSSPNSVAPYKTPLSSMSPTIVCKRDIGEPFLTCGSAGGPRIVSATLQTVLNVILFGMGIQEAIDAARFHYQGGGKFIAESRINSEVLNRLRQEAGYEIELMPDYDLALGGVQGIEFKFDHQGREKQKQKKEEKKKMMMMTGGADPRRESVAVEY